jgi:hypothetical protein
MASFVIVPDYLTKAFDDGDLDNYSIESGKRIFVLKNAFVIDVLDHQLIPISSIPSDLPV